MSGAPKNIQRDGIYYEPDGVMVAPTVWTIPNNPNLNGPASVFYDYGEVQASAGSSFTSLINQVAGVGLHIEPARVDRVPYRVKASVHMFNFDHNTGVIGIGYGPATVTGLGDTINGVRYIPFKDTFDEVIMVEPEMEGDTYYNRPVAFIVALAPKSAVSSDMALLHMSVQNLAVKPPTMQNAVS